MTTIVEKNAGNLSESQAWFDETYNLFSVNDVQFDNVTFGVFENSSYVTSLKRA